MSEYLDLTLAKRKRRVASAAKLCQIKEVRNWRTVLFRLFILGSDTYAGSRKKLPLTARDFPGSKDLVQVEDADVNRSGVKATLVTNVAHPIDEIPSVREVGGRRIEATRRHKVDLSLPHIEIEVLCTDVQDFIDRLLKFKKKSWRRKRAGTKIE
jgi:hypothetical protein